MSAKCRVSCRKRSIPLSRAILLCAAAAIWVAAGPLWGQPVPNLSLAPVVSDCGFYVEVPIMFVQPETSNIHAVSFEIVFSPEVFEDRFFGPNDARNMPAALRGFSLSSAWGSHFPIFVYRAEEQGQAVPGRWRIEIMSDGTRTGMKLPSGELMRLRFYPFSWVTPGGYEISFAYGVANFFNTAGGFSAGLTIQNGMITLVPCAPNTTLPPSTNVTTTTTSTTFRPTTTTLSRPVLQIGTVFGDCGLYVDIPVVFMQIEASSISSMALEFNFSADIFQEQYVGPDNIANTPQILPGFALTQWAATPHVLTAQPSLRSGVPTPGAWDIFLTPAQGFPNTVLPSGELFRVRLFLRSGAPAGVYPLTISPLSIFYDLLGTPLRWLPVQNGQVFLGNCNP